MEMHQIRYFLAVSQTLNFTRAAEECHVSQPALTRAIQALEDELGGQLVRRERTLSHLTELGQRMLPLLMQCYESAVTAKSLASSFKTGETNSLSIALSPTINVGLLTQPLKELVAAYPGLQLRLHRASAPEIVEILKRDEAELAIAGPLGVEWERLESWPLFAEPFALTVLSQHKLASQNQVTFEHLAEEQFIVCADCEGAEHLQRHLSENDIATESAHRVSTDYDLVALLKSSFGIAILPASTCRPDEFRRVPVKGLNLNRTVKIYAVAGRRRTAPANLLANMLRAADWSCYVN